MQHPIVLGVPNYDAPACDYREPASETCHNYVCDDGGVLHTYSECNHGCHDCKGHKKGDQGRCQTDGDGSSGRSYMVDCGERIFGNPIAQAYIHSYDNPECAGEPTWYEQKCCTESEAPHAACSIECHNYVSDHHDNDDHDDNAAVWLIVTLLIILVVLCFCGILVCICVGVWRLNAKNRRPHLQAPVGNPSGGYQMRRIVLPPVDRAQPVGGAHCQACGRKYNGGTAPPKYCASCGAQVVAEGQVTGLFVV